MALLRLERGEVDILGDGIPPAKFLEVKNDPQWKGNVIEGGQLHTGYVTMNVNIPPFDNQLVRQAVNQAINKERIIKIINGRAVPANQPLPPAMPGYAKDYQGYAYDPAKAKAMLAEAGFADGFDTELYAMNTDPNPRIAQAIQQDLAEIGIHAELKTLAQANVIAAGGEASEAPMIWSGGMAWIADFPDPSNFYGPILGCAGAVPGGWNWSWYCNEELDKKAAEADAMTDPAKADQRLALWRDIFLKIMDDAPWAPVFNEQRFTMKSDRARRRRMRSSSTPCTSRSTTTWCMPKMPSKPAAPKHTIHQHRHHFGWDNANPPALTVAPGETVAFETVDASGRQLTPASTVADVAALDFGKVNPVTGPVYVDGAEPGDALKVTIESFAPSGWGWTANIPGFGLLTDQFPEPALHLWKYDPATMAPAHVRARRPGAAEALHRHDRLRTRRARAAQHRAAALGRRQHGHPRHRGRHHPLPAGRGRRALCSRSATAMPPRATARSAAPRSRAR